MNTRSFLISALLGGVIMAVLGNFPFLNILNCVLCMWVWLSGILAVYFYRRFEAANPNLSVGQGLALGAVAGVIGAIIGSIIGAIFKTAGSAAAATFLRNMPGYTSDMDTYVNLIASSGFSFFTMGCDLVLYTLFGAVGGLIGTALIWKAPTQTQ